MSKNTSSEYFELLLEQENDIIRKGHFILSSGLHSDTYINKDAVWTYPEIMSEIINEYCQLILESEIEYDFISGVAISGAVIAAPIAILLKKPFVYPEKDNDKFIFQRGFDGKIRNKNIILIEDILTTGRSIAKVRDAIINCGGNIVGLFTLWNRLDQINLNALCKSIISKPLSIYNQSDCPLCKNNIMINLLKK